jgi:CDGSH-type Zn-finger protein
MAQVTPGPSNSEAEIRIERNGPYLLTKVEHLTNWLGEEIPLQQQTELCRCGQSSNKPFCDGSHTVAKFSGEKDPKRVPDKCDVFEGQQLEIFDNRAFVRTQASAPTVWLRYSMPGESRSLLRAAEEWMRLLRR